MSTSVFKYNIEGLANDMEIDLPTISTLYAEFFFEMKANINETKILSKNGDWKNVEEILHNIKGICTSLNIDDLYNIVNKLDSELKRKIYDNVMIYLDSIINLFVSCENDIREFFKEKNIII